MLNRQRNELHAAFEAGPSEEAEQLRLLQCRPELAAQKDSHGALPLHAAAVAGASLRAIEECARIFPDAPRARDANGFLPHQLALEHGHRSLAELLASRAGKQLPLKPVRSVLLIRSSVTSRDDADEPCPRDAPKEHAVTHAEEAGACLPTLTPEQPPCDTPAEEEPSLTSVAAGGAEVAAAEDDG